MDLSSQLRNIGLSSYEARAYFSLLENPEQTAEEVSRNSKVPMAKMYSVLNSLMKLGMIKSTTTRPKIYAALPPEESIPGLIEKKKREIEELEKSAQKTAEKLQEVYKKNKQESRTNVWQVLEEDALWREFKRAMLTRKESAYTLANTKNWKYVFKHPEVLPDKLIDSKVVGKMIIPKEIMTKKTLHKLPVKLLKMYSRPTAFIRTIPEEKIQTPMQIVDEERVGIPLIDPETKKFIGGTIIEGKQAVKPYVDYFNMMWEKAEHTEHKIRLALQAELAKRRILRRK